VRSNSKAGGDTLVDFKGMTLYTSVDDRDACRKDCLKSWAPFSAGELAKPVGDWTIAEREDGTRQWVYQGRAVYTFKGDGRAGDAQGILFDPTWQAATVRRYFMPAQVQLRKSGSVLTFTTANGMTLYARDKYVYAPGSFHADEGSLSNIGTGREIGTSACDQGCDPAWTPFKAAADAQPSGYWSILTRADGTRQWAYQGYALYTNAKDKKPGEMMGRDTFDFTDGSHAMYWRIAAP
jgi:predicted lipoprotein with Yx(FWY)xxD motif